MKLCMIVRSIILFIFFFFKQKTAYEMRISDWSSDVCSSDLTVTLPKVFDLTAWNYFELEVVTSLTSGSINFYFNGQVLYSTSGVPVKSKIGRASCRERVCQYV